MSGKLILLLLGAVLVVVAVLYLPNAKIGEFDAEVVRSTVRTNQQQQRVHSLEVRLPDGTVTSVRARSFQPLREGHKIKVEKRMSWSGLTFYVWRGD